MTLPAALPPNPGTDIENPDYPKCSKRRCETRARWSVVWNNPKIHTPDREKIWAACDLHRDDLSGYLTVHRMNLLRVDPIDAPSPTNED